MKKNLLFVLLFIVGCESSNDSVNLSSGNGFSSDFSSGSESSTGIGGSMARFTIVDDYLYTVDSWTLKSYDISDQENPVHRDDVIWGGE